MRCQNPFPLPDYLGAGLQPVVSLWQGLKRGENAIPFADDLGIDSLIKRPGNTFLLRVFQSPDRYRIEFLGDSLQHSAVAGSFLDEISPKADFSYLRAQSSATVEAVAPTLLRLTPLSGQSFLRIVLPLWRNGQVDMLLGAVDHSQ